MSHSRATNVSDDLEHLELTHEVAAAQAIEREDQPSSARPSPSQKTSRRVSIGSTRSNASSSTVKRHGSQEHHHGGYSGSGTANTGLGIPSRFSRHSTALLDTPSGSRRRRPSYGKRPESSRSSIRQRNRSSGDDDDDEENSDDDEDDNHFGDGRPHSRMRRHSRRSNRHSPSRDYDERSSDDRDQYRGSGDEDEDDRGDNEPLTLKDRQEYVERELLPRVQRTDILRASVASDYSGQGNGGDESRPLLSRSSSMFERERKEPRLWRIISAIKNLPRNIYHLGLGGIVYYIFYYTLIGPLHILVSSLCWFMVVSIPMGKFTYVLASNLHRNPLRLNFKRGSSLTLSPQRSEILLCTYDAIGFQYYKYTYDGINIIFINLMPVVFFTILDEYVLTNVLGHDSALTSPAVIFSLGLASVIPLSYFIGMAVSSISAQSSLGMGAVINATFGSIIEIILYSVALTEGKGLITEGALIGSFLAGLLLMPGTSMMSGAVKKKEQRFNAKSAGVTATMLIMSLIGVLTPTLFYSIYGRFELRCTPCPESAPLPMGVTCQRCYHYQPNPANDIFFQTNVKPLMYFCCIILPSAYLIGIWFSLRTHVKQIWHETHQPPIQDSSIYRKLLPTHIVQQLLHYGSGTASTHRPLATTGDAELGNFQPSANHQAASVNDGVSERRPSHSAPRTGASAVPALHPAAQGLLSSFAMDQDSLKHEHGESDEEAHGGHDSPNWSKAKSATVLLSCTILYSIVAEILVNSVDAVSSIDEKLLGLVLFALVPNVTEFMNAISFAMYGNIALSMEIGSAYALQVCLIQIPAMVAISAWLNYGKEEMWKHTFNLIFPRWDVFTMLFSVFLLTYTYIEGKSNYFKGSILILSYLVLMAGFVYAPASPDNGEVNFMMAK
ncbi:hypothetical protein BGZ80_000856 [Entomortierella chlamydospora]|uniref:Sodium/calcium exchanger membrane region domain-containing protein n=1 Tax=Entomortierella chlamydospora TaxID=101097 RepID=A0A9P6T3L9_9FUNG|nr:hypothetical protein BGZ80_000856 [Entomortierella chlamydospora]